MFDRLITNARVVTLNPAQPQATTLAIYRDRIVAVGDESLRAFTTAATQIDDLDGAVVLPGLVDAHVHWEWTARSLREIPLFNLPDKAASVAAIAQALPALLPTLRPDEWIMGRGWTNSAWPDGAFPTATDLDAITGARPAMFKARSSHAAWLNSAALQRAGITDSTPDPQGGMILRDARGQATGILLETAIAIADQALPPVTAHDLAAMMDSAQTQAWRAGLVGLHDFDNPSAFEAMQILLESGRLGLRILKQINDPFIHHAHGLAIRSGFGNDWLRFGALKLFADGALGTRTALMIAPYEGEPDNYGVAVKSQAELQRFISEASKMGIASTVHAIGDQAVRNVLDAFTVVRQEEHQRGIHPTARRHRIEHVQLIDPTDAPRLAALDLIASMQPIHATADYPVADRYWGARAAWGYNPRLQLDLGARVAFGSDSPIEPFDPIKNIYAAVARRRADGSPGPSGWYPDARISVQEAIRGFTAGPAYAAHVEDRMGQIAPGFLADLIALDRDLLTIPTEEILATKVVGTMVGGVWRHYAI